MEVKKAGKVSFCSMTLTNNSSVWMALPKYRKSLAAGILDTFETLANNGADDKVAIVLGHKPGARKHTTDVLSFVYYSKYNSLQEQSSASFSPRKLERLSKENLSKLFFNTYEKLKTSTEKALPSDEYLVPNPKDISNSHMDLLKKLDKYSIDDMGFM